VVVTIIEKKDMSRRNFEDASCEICCDPGTMEEQVQPTTDLYQCSACNRTYHWMCLNSLGCYTDDQGAGIIADEEWACPACVNLHPTQKTKRRNDSETELIEVSWLPTWEPEELMLSWDS